MQGAARAYQRASPYNRFPRLSNFQTRHTCLPKRVLKSFLAWASPLARNGIGLPFHHFSRPRPSLRERLCIEENQTRIRPLPSWTALRSTGDYHHEAHCILIGQECTKRRIAKAIVSTLDRHPERNRIRAWEVPWEFRRASWDLSGGMFPFSLHGAIRVSENVREFVGFLGRSGRIEPTIPRLVGSIDFKRHFCKQR